MRKKLFLAFIIGFTMVVNAQQKSCEIHVGASFPTAQFADSESKDGGGAATGVNLGLKFFHPIKGLNGLFFSVGADFFCNGFNSSAKSQLDAAFANPDLNKSSVTYPKYINVPLLVGLSFQLPLDKSISFTGDALVGVSYSVMTDYSLEVESQGQFAKLVIESDPSFKFASQFGFGFLFQNKYSLALHYNPLTYSYLSKAKFTVNGIASPSSPSTSGDLKESILNLTLGVRL